MRNSLDLDYLNEFPAQPGNYVEDILIAQIDEGRKVPLAPAIALPASPVVRFQTMVNAELASLRAAAEYLAVYSLPELAQESHGELWHIANRDCSQCVYEVRGIVAFRMGLIRRFSDSVMQPKLNRAFLALQHLICPNCPKQIKPGRKFCSPTCALVYAAHARRKIESDKLRELHLVEWLPVALTAERLGITKAGISTAIGRLGLHRQRTPEICRIPGCGKPTYFRLNVRGQKVGNKCLEHWREAHREYTRQYRERNGLGAQSTSEQRQEHSRRAFLARWEKHRLVHGDTSIAARVAEVLRNGPMQLREIQDAVNNSATSVSSAIKRNPAMFRRLAVGRYGLIDSSAD